MNDDKYNFDRVKNVENLLSSFSLCHKFYYRQQFKNNKDNHDFFFYNNLKLQC